MPPYRLGAWSVLDGRLRDSSTYDPPMSDLMLTDEELRDTAGLRVWQQCRRRGTPRLNRSHVSSKRFRPTSSAIGA